MTPVEEWKIEAGLNKEGTLMLAFRCPDCDEYLTACTLTQAQSFLTPGVCSAWVGVERLTAGAALEAARWRTEGHVCVLEGGR